MPDLGEAPNLAAALLDIPELQQRWAHVRAVAARAAQLVAAVEPADRELLVAAAWLHDIGYSPRLIQTGLHSLDGARHLQQLGFPRRLSSLVAHHSGARFEAGERELASELNTYQAEDSHVADALTTADLTTGPDGNPVTVNQRITEILSRYPAGSPVHRAVTLSRPLLVDQVHRALGRLESSAGDQPRGRSRTSSSAAHRFRPTNTLTQPSHVECKVDGCKSLVDSLLRSFLDGDYDERAGDGRRRGRRRRGDDE